MYKQMTHCWKHHFQYRVYYLWNFSQLQLQTVENTLSMLDMSDYRYTVYLSEVDFNDLYSLYVSVLNLATTVQVTNEVIFQILAML